MFPGTTWWSAYLRGCHHHALRGITLSSAAFTRYPQKVCKWRRRCTLLLVNTKGLEARRRRATAMHQRTTSGNLTSSPTWEGLHEWLRNAIQALIQEALEAEVTELLGRVRYQRR